MASPTHGHEHKHERHRAIARANCDNEVYQNVNTNDGVKVQCTNTKCGKEFELTRDELNALRHNWLKAQQQHVPKFSVVSPSGLRRNSHDEKVQLAHVPDYYVGEKTFLEATSKMKHAKQFVLFHDTSASGLYMPLMCAYKQQNGDIVKYMVQTEELHHQHQQHIYYTVVNADNGQQLTYACSSLIKLCEYIDSYGLAAVNSTIK